MNTNLRTLRTAWLVAATIGLAACAPQTGQDTAPTITSTPTSTPTTATSTTSETTATTEPSSEDNPHVDVRGWPDTTQNAAGVYSWDASRCAGQFCNVGWMHNGYGSGDVDITFSRGASGLNGDGATAVTVGGYEGIHQQISALREKWYVDIDGTSILILLSAEPGTSHADLAEARAIIDSIRTEPMDNRLGFRLVFTLSTNDWDSG
jgi:hypothetical protein